MECTEQSSTVLTVHEAGTKLKIGRNNAYTLVKEAYKTGEPFHVVMIGNQYRIVTASFNEWLSKQ